MTYYEKNKQKILDQQKQQYNTPIGKKKAKIKRWKSQGIIDGDFNLLYDAVEKTKNCYICFKLFIKNYDKTLDHDHITGEPRYICCRNCNGNFLRESNRMNQYDNKTKK